VLFHLITNVWGERHTATFLQSTLPNVMSSGNLPALARAHEVRYRIYTTPADRARIESSAPGQRLARLVNVEFVTPLGERKPDVSHHVHWFHRTAAEAKREGAIAVFVPPDTLWSDGSFRRLGEVMAQGYKAVANPFLQVVAETCVPEILERFGGQPDGNLCIPAGALYDLAKRHLHPLTALAMPGSPHGRPALELYWPVPREGIVSRFAVRELFAFDPRRCPITFLWYAGGKEDREGIYFASGPEDIGMLSVDHLDKYIENYIVGHTVTAADVVRSTLHPWNNTEQTRTFARQPIEWHAGQTTLSSWRRTEARATLAMREVEVRRSAQRLWTLLRDIGCDRAAGILALVLEATPLARRWRTEVPLTVFVPTNAALAAPEGHRFVKAPSVDVTLALKHFARHNALRVKNLLRRLARRGWTVLRQIIGDRYANAIARRLKARLARYRPTAAASPATATQIVPELHWVDKLLLVGAEPALMRFLKRHVFAGDIGSTAGRFPSIEGSAIDIQAGPSGQKIDGCNLVGGPYTLDGITVWVVDGVFQPGKAR
jgi:uncharacterized surface protein with fasciclin (FAS1) repeats